MMKLLVATDLSERGDRALRRAVRLCKKLKADLTILHIVDEALPSRIAQEVKTSNEAYIRETMSDLGIVGSSKTKTVIKFGHAWETIIDVANQSNTDLLIMGAHRNRGIKDLFIGTTLNRVARAIDRSVLVVTREPTSDYSDAIVGTDFSDSARNAALTTARLTDVGSITFVHAYHIPGKGLVMRTDETGDISVKERRLIEKPILQEFEAWVKSLPESLQHANRRMLEGGPVRVLADTVLKTNSEMLALGQHSRSGFVEAFLGSTAGELMSDPPTDLLLTPATK